MGIDGMVSVQIHWRESAFSVSEADVETRFDIRFSSVQQQIQAHRIVNGAIGRARTQFGGGVQMSTLSPRFAGRGWKKKTPDSVGRRSCRKVAIRPFNVGQLIRVNAPSMWVCLRKAALNGRMPTFRIASVARNAIGVFFFQGGCKSGFVRSNHAHQGQQAARQTYGWLTVVGHDVSQRLVVPSL